MSLKRLAIICTLSSFLVGCSEFYGSQPPAPVYGGSPKSQKPLVRAQKKAKSKIANSKETVKTQPLQDYSAIQLEPLAPSTLPLVESTPVETPVPLSPAMTPIEARQFPATATAPAATETKDILLAPAATGTLEAPPPPPPPPVPELTQFEPMESTVRLSPAVGALVSAANQNSQAGDLESAAASIERAIRIEPRNANLFYKLALIRIKQAKPRLAEDLAKKSELLAASDNKLKKHCWLLIAHAREMQQDFSGAKEANKKADRL